MKYIIALTALSMFACAPSTQVRQAETPQSVTILTELPSSSPVTVEAANSQMAQVIPCHDDLDCMQKVTGVCPNGYRGGQKLTAENDRRVGILFKCITDEEKLEQAKEEEQEKEWRAARQEQMQQERLKFQQQQAAEQQKKVTPNKK